MIIRRFDEILELLYLGYNHKVIIQLLSKLWLLIFFTSSFTLPIKKMKARWKVESRKLSKIVFYDGTKKIMEDIIVQLKIGKKHD